MYYLQQVTCASVGAILVLLGLTFPYYWSKILMVLVERDLVLSPTSKSYGIWEGTPVPITMDFYFWNWTNSEHLYTQKPAFVELGPYRFREFHQKENISWNDNGTVTFQMKRTWFFDEEYSNGTLDDKVTTLNAIAMTAAHTVRDWSFFYKGGLSLTLSATEQEVSINRRVGELLFEGYTDKLIDIARTLPQFSGVDIPFDRFGWFYKMNESTMMDGTVTMNTGKYNIRDIGQIEAWNYNNKTKFFDGQCSELKGSAGELYPPGVKKESLTLFSTNLCRSVTFGYTDDQVVHGITGHRFTGGSEMIDNGTLYPDQECFCGGECLPSGVINVTACRYGAPAFASFPHFHLADPIYRDAVDGMKPDPNKHTFYINLDPVTGVPLDIRARLQINILMRPVKSIGLFKDVPEVMVPMLWFEQSGTLTTDLAFELRTLLFLFTIDFYIAFVIAMSGFSLLVYTALTFPKKLKEKQSIELSLDCDEITSLRTGTKILP
uniref:Uncharacterized protein n=1 Tax=Clastoptera arizonana TaxID=38151 RepID=A0A1B6CTY0_9HEMI